MISSWRLRQVCGDMAICKERKNRGKVWNGEGPSTEDIITVIIFKLQWKVTIRDIEVEDLGKTRDNN